MVDFAAPEHPPLPQNLYSPMGLLKFLQRLKWKTSISIQTSLELYSNSKQRYKFRTFQQIQLKPDSLVIWLLGNVQKKRKSNKRCKEGITVGWDGTPDFSLFRGRKRNTYENVPKPNIFIFLYFLSSFLGKITNRKIKAGLTWICSVVRSYDEPVVCVVELL